VIEKVGTIFTIKSCVKFVLRVVYLKVEVAMKTLLTQPSIRGAALFVILLFLSAGCEKFATIIEPDDNASQTLIIKKGKPNPFSLDAFEAKLDDDDYYAIMWIGHIKGEQSELPLPNHPGGTWGGTYNDVIVQMWSIKDRQNFAFADLGTVQLGSTIIPVWKGGGVVKYEIGGELRELTHYYQLIRNEDDDNPLFTGNNLFTISNSSDVQNVSVELNLPEKNIILNVAKGQTVDPDQDWVIELKHPMIPDQDGLLLYERSDKFITNDWQNQFDGVSHLIIQVTEPTQVIRIPSQDLQELRSNSSINLYTLALHPGPRVIAKVPLHRHDGTLNETLTIPSYQSHLIEFKFKE
jgi:hypothetical protein